MEIEEFQSPIIKDKAQETRTTSSRRTFLALNAFLKNKINAKNCFDVPFPRVSHVTKHEVPNKENWMAYSTVLQAGTQLYSHRVDQLLMSTRSILEEVSRASIQEEKNKEKASAKPQKRQLNEETNFSVLNIGEEDSMSLKLFDEEDMMLEFKN